jgi:hypothetical protein
VADLVGPRQEATLADMRREPQPDTHGWKANPRISWSDRFSRRGQERIDWFRLIFVRQADLPAVRFHTGTFSESDRAITVITHSNRGLDDARKKYGATPFAVARGAPTIPVPLQRVRVARLGRSAATTSAKFSSRAISTGY